MAEYESVPDPSVGEWYLDRVSQEEFKVVNVDEDFGTVEVQFLNGEIAEFAEEEWSARELAHVEPPEDWTVALEPVEDGDAGYQADPGEPRPQPTPGFETDEALLSDEAESRDEVVDGSETEEE